MKFNSLCEVISAVHLSKYVTGPFEQRGGLFLVKPAGHLGTSAIEIIEHYDRVLVISDLTVKSITAMREDFLGGKIITLAFSDYEKLYKRHASVSSNLEGIIMSLAEEGFRNPAFSDQRVQATPARCAVLGAMTTGFYERMSALWLENGFMRRFLWARYNIDDDSVIEDAIGQWRKAELDGNFVTTKTPTNKVIPYSLTAQESNMIRHTLRFQRDRRTPYILAQRIFCVLKWKFGNERNASRKAMAIWHDFAESLAKDGGVLQVRERGIKPNKNGRR